MLLSAAVIFALSFLLPKSIEYKREPPPPPPEPSATPPDIEIPTPEMSTPQTDVSSDCEPLRLVDDAAASTGDSKSNDEILNDFEN